jgi:hypothetical protein
LITAEPAIFAVWYRSGESLVGCFNPAGTKGTLEVPVSDGSYTDLLTDETVVVNHNRMEIPASAVIFRYPGQVPMQFFYSDLLNFHLPPD